MEKMFKIFFYTGLVLQYCQDILNIWLHKADFITAIVVLVNDVAHRPVVIAGVAPLTTWYCDIFRSGKSWLNVLKIDSYDHICINSQQARPLNLFENFLSTQGRVYFFGIYISSLNVQIIMPPYIIKNSFNCFKRN